MNRPTLPPAMLNPLLALQAAARTHAAPGGAADEARPFEFARALDEARQSVRLRAPEPAATAPRPLAEPPPHAPPHAPPRPAESERPARAERSEHPDRSTSGAGDREPDADATARPRPAEETETARPARQVHREAGSSRASRSPTPGHPPARGQTHAAGTRKSAASASSAASAADAEAGAGTAGEAERAKLESGVGGTPADAGRHGVARMGANQGTSIAAAAATDATSNDAAMAGTVVTAGNSGIALAGDASAIERLERANTLSATGAAPSRLTAVGGTADPGDAPTSRARAATALLAGAGDAMANPALPDATKALRTSSSTGGEAGGALAAPATGSPDLLPNNALGSLITPSATSASSATAAALTSREATLASPPGSEGFARELGTQLSVFVREGVQHARLQLHPQELGPVLVRIQLEGQAAQVHMAAELPQTRSALEQALPTLASQLSDAGITLTGGGVSERPPGDFGGFGGSAADDRGAREAASGRGSEVAAAGNGTSHAAAQATPSGGWSRARGLVDLVA